MDDIEDKGRETITTSSQREGPLEKTISQIVIGAFLDQLITKIQIQSIQIQIQIQMPISHIMIGATTWPRAQRMPLR